MLSVPFVDSQLIHVSLGLPRRIVVRTSDFVVLPLNVVLATFFADNAFDVVLFLVVNFTVRMWRRWRYRIYGCTLVPHLPTRLWNMRSVGAVRWQDCHATLQHTPRAVTWRRWDHRTLLQAFLGGARGRCLLAFHGATPETIAGEAIVSHVKCAKMS